MSDKPDRYMIIEENGKRVILDKEREYTLDLECACKILNVKEELLDWMKNEWGKESEARRALNEEWHQRYARELESARRRAAA